MYHDNSAVTVSTATALLASFANTILVAAELQVPLLPFLATCPEYMTSGRTAEKTLSQREDPFLERIPRKHPVVVT
jgi:hypothetical protein